VRYIFDIVPIDDSSRMACEAVSSTFRRIVIGNYSPSNKSSHTRRI